MNGFDPIDPSEFDIGDDELELVKQRIMRRKLAESLQDNKSEMAEPILGALAGGIDVLSRHSAAQLDPVATITGIPVKGYTTPNAAGEFQKALLSRQNKAKTKALDETQMLKNLEDIKTNRLKAMADAAYKQHKNLTDLYRAQQWAEVNKQNAKTNSEKARWDMEAKAIANAIQKQRADTYAAEQAARAELQRAQAQKYGVEAEQIEALTPEKVSKMGAETGLIGEKTTTESQLRGPRQNLLEAQAEAARAKATKDKEGKPVDSVKGESSLRKEYQDDPATKRTQIISESFAKIAQSVNNPSAASDVSLIYNFMRMNDPTSTVRETEFATAQNAAGVPERVRNLFNRLQTGERLTPQQRADFYATAENMFNAQLEQQAAIDRQFGALADQYGYKRENVLRQWVKQEMKPKREKQKPSKEEALQELRRRGRIK